MVKKIVSMLLVLAVAASLGLNVFANNPTGENNGTEDSVTTENVTDEGSAGEAEEPGISLDFAISSASIKETEQFLAKITKPEGHITVFKKLYKICGYSSGTDTDVEVVLTIFNSDTQKYEEFRNTDGDSRWGIGSFGVFSKEVELKEDTNRLKIIVYKKSEADNLKPGVNLQVNYYTVTVRNESLKDLIVKSVVDITEAIKGIFK